MDDPNRPRAHTFGGVPSSDSSIDVVLRPSHSDIMVSPNTSMQQPPHPHKLDKFGFILNMDHNGNILRDVPKKAATVDDDLKASSASAARNIVTPARLERRLQKWNKMMASWGTASNGNSNNNNSSSRTRKQDKRLKRRLRKGLPDSLRTQVWLQLAGVPQKIKEHPGVYDSLVRQTLPSSSGGGGVMLDDSNNYNTMASSPPAAAAAPPPTLDNPLDDQEIHFTQTKAFLMVQETIERDIHRTFPRHSLFYDVDEDAITGHNKKKNSDNHHQLVLCGAATTELSHLMMDDDDDDNGNNSPTATALATTKGGQASLRRLLKAYSVYDRDVGYCQGMNFIAGMLLTLNVSEEEAFWLFTYIMHSKPCQMHGMFGEHMSETHKVLFVAEQLIQQFLPKLYKHLDREHVHITMFATQWLLTQYTSSFPFDLVTRIWDCFLVEGWKVTYRIMLALLVQCQAKLLKMSFEEILAFFRTMPESVEGAATMEAALKIPLKTAHIAKYEREWEAQQAAKAASR